MSIPNAEAVYVTARQLRHRYGGVSHMWIERRLAAGNFPTPIYFGRLRYWRLDEIEAFERRAARESKGRATAAA